MVTTVRPAGERLDDEGSAAFATGEGAAVVLLHGLGMSWRAWRPLLPALSRRYAVFAPTLPGHRGGPDPVTAVGIAGFADALETQLDARGLERAHLVGNSLGGWLSLELARRGRALSVTAISPAGAWRHAGDQWRVHSLLRTADALNRLPLTAALSPGLHSPQVRRAVFRRLMERGDRMTRAEALDVLRDAHACSVVPDLLRAGRSARLAPLADLQIPIRVVWGRHDRVIPYRRHGRPLRAALPGAVELSLPGAGHVPMYDARDLLVGLLVDQISTAGGH